MNIASVLLFCFLLDAFFNAKVTVTMPARRKRSAVVAALADDAGSDTESLTPDTVPGRKPDDVEEGDEGEESEEEMTESEVIKLVRQSEKGDKRSKQMIESMMIDDADEVGFPD